MSPVASRPRGAGRPGQGCLRRLLVVVRVVHDDLSVGPHDEQVAAVGRPQDIRDKYLPGGTGDHRSPTDQQHMVRRSGVVKVVGGHHHGGTPGAFCGNGVKDALARHDIESGHGLVEQQQVCLWRQALGNEDTLALPARQLIDLPVAKVHHVHAVHGGAHRVAVPAAIPRPGQAHHAPQPEAPHPHRLAGSERQAVRHLGGLQHQRHPVPLRTGLPAEYLHAAAFCAKEAGHEVQQGGFPGTVGTDDRREFPRGYGEVRPPQHGAAATPYAHGPGAHSGVHGPSVARTHRQGKPPMPENPAPVTSAPNPGRRRAVATLLALGVAVAVAVLATPAPVAAHAVLIATSPGDGERLASAPSEVGFTFSEPVSVGLGGVAVYDRFGTRHDTGTLTQPAPNLVRAAIAGDLEPGSYLATYRVTSADGHVVTGASLFAVATELDADSVRDVAGGPGWATRVAQVVANVAVYGGVLLAVGLALFARLLVRTADDVARLGRLARLAITVGAVGAVAVIVSRASEATGLGLGAIAHDGVASAIVRQGGLGWWLVALLVGLAVVWVGVGLRAASSAAPAVVLYGSLVVAGSFALTGHSVGASPAVVVGLANAVHLLVAAVWLGGLVGIAGIVGAGRRDPGRDPAAAALVVGRFSTVAVVAVAALWVSGAVQAWWTVGSARGLIDTGYGQLLVAKLVLVVVAVAGAWWNRYRLIPQLAAATPESAPDGPGPATGSGQGQPATQLAASHQQLATLTPGDVSDGAVADTPANTPGGVVAPAWRRLSTTLRIELVLLAAVVVVTSVLVDTTPARSVASAAQPFEATLPVTADLEVNLFVTPGVTGPNEIHVTYIEPDGLLSQRVEGMELELALPALDIGPIALGGLGLEQGHYVVATEALAVEGVWRVEVLTRVDRFSSERTVFEVPVS